MKSDEIYRQKPIDKQNYGFSQKLDRTDNIASDCFWYNHYH